jgi:hypothetical protein
MIVIDPGHGGHGNTGRSTPYGSRSAAGLLEKDVNLRLARRVATRIGRPVGLTRDGDVNLSLAERTAIATRFGARTFVSLHSGGMAPGERGVDAWIHPQAGTPCHALARRLLEGVGRKGVRIGGVRTGELAVLRPDRLPGGAAACLVEVGFPEAAYGDPTAALDRVADGLADALAGIEPPSYDPHSSADSLRALARWQEDLSRFLAGVPAGAHGIFPHSSICKLYTCRGASCYQAVGPAPTGFFIAPDRILTAGHVTRGTTSCRVAPGEANDSPLGSFEVDTAAAFITHPRYADSDFDLGVIKFPARSVQAFELGVLDQSVHRGVTVCGYAGQINAADLEAWRMSTGIDPSLQHLSSGGATATANLESLHYDIQSLPGTSGAPVMWVRDGRLLVIGVHSGGGGGHVNVGCRLTDEKIRWALSV